MKRNKQAELIGQMSTKELTFHLLVSQCILLIIALIIGIFLFNHLSAFFSLFRLEWSIITLGLTSGILVVLIDVFLMKILPKHYYDDGGINERIFANRSVASIALLSIIIAFSEEILFRGVLQTHFGLIITSIIFAIVHVRYWSHWFLITNVLVLSFWIGLVYEFSGNNLLVPITMHFTIDFLLGLVIQYNVNGSGREDDEK